MAEAYDHPNFPRPPITEAVIALDFSSEIAFSDLANAIKDFRKHYVHETRQKNIELNVIADTGKSSFKEHEAGVKFRSEDETDILMIDRQRFIVSRLAPYSGWSELSGRMQRDYSVFIKNLGRRAVSRIGCRFINRIDIPVNHNEPELSSDWINIDVDMPTDWSTEIIEYGVRIVRKVPEFDANINIMSGTMKSPVPDCVSILLDIDAYQSNINTRHPSDIIQRLERLRELKNRAFLASITEKTRRLFE